MIETEKPNTSVPSSRKLHLGCGNVKIPGYTNVDMTPSPAVDVLTDARFLSGVKPDSVECIYACNLLEHFKRLEYMFVLYRWHEVLQPGGILRLSVPDFEALCDYYSKTKNMFELYAPLYSCQGKEYSFHYWTWDFATLKRDLTKVGFIDIKRYDFKTTEHAHVRDWSMNYLPRYDKNGNVLPDDEWVKGQFIALNVEATKNDIGVTGNG